MLISNCPDLSTESNRVRTREIARRKRTEQTSIECEGVHPRLFEQASIGTLILDNAGNIMTVNSDMARMSGYTMEELQVLGREALIPDPKLLGDLFRISSKSDKMPNLEVRFKRKDGTEYEAMLNVEPIELREQRALLITARDMTEPRRMEEGIKKSELEYKVRAAQSLQALAVVHDSRIVFCNRAFADIFGYSVDELLALSPEEAAALAHPEDRDLVSRCLADGISGKRVPQRCECRGIKKDGTVCWLEVFSSPKEYDGKPAVQAIFEDVTERKLAERNLRFLLARQTALLAAVPDIIMQVDINRVYTWANDAGFEFFGDDVIGKEAADYFEGEQATYNAVDTLWGGDEHTVYVESWQQRNDGQKRLLAWRCHTLKDDQGKVIGALSSARDITDSRQAEDALRQSEERFRLIAETIDDVFWIYEAEKGTTYISPAHERIWGFPREILYRDPKAYYHHILPEDRERVADNMARMKAGLAVDFEYRIRRSDGTVRQIWERGYPVRDHGRRGPRCVGLAQDVTELRRAEWAHKKSTDYLNQIINHIGDPVFVLDREHRFVLVNDAASALAGLGREEMLGKTLFQCGLSNEHTDSIWKEEDCIFESGKDSVVEEKVPDAQGNIHTVVTKKTLLTDSAGNAQIVGILRDITKRKAMEEELWKSELRHRTLLEQLQQGLAIFQDSRIVFCNQSYGDIFGYSVEELLSFSPEQILSLTHPEDQELVVRLRSDRLAGKPVPSHYEQRGIRRDGSLCWLEVFASLISYEAKPAVQVVFMDVTERKQATTALQESEQRFKLITETIEEVFWHYDIKRGSSYVSPAHERIWGYPLKMFYENPDSYFDHIHPDDRERVKAANLALTNAGHPVDHEYRIIRPDGSVRWIWDRGFPVFGEDGRPSHYVGVAQEVTERKRADQALKESAEYMNQILNRMSDHIFVMDREHRFILVNDASCAFNGKSREELLGKSVTDLLPEDLAAAIWEQDEKVFQTGEECTVEDNFTDSRGNLHTTMTIKSPLIRKSGEKQVICVLRDITEYKRLETQFLQAQKMEAIGVLAGGVAHDFNNLLNVINGYTELALEDLAQDNPVRQDLEQVKEAGRRAASLTSKLLAFGRKQISRPEALDLNKVVKDMGSLLRRLIGEDIDLIAKTQRGVGLVKADPVQIQQILMNLAVNARDAIQDGGKITIETANVDLDADEARQHPTAVPGSYVMLAVSDNGTGMDAATQSHLFEPFFTTKEKGKGTGLGLSTVYGVVKQSNGSIWVYSELGKGTTFKIYFPRIDDDVATVTDGSKFQSGSRGSETILVTEDEAAVRALACRILRERGYNVLEAANGNEALDIFGAYAGKIDLVLSDVIMPGMNGKELVSRLESLRPGIKTLYISGYTDNSIIHHGTLDSNMAFLQKPFTAEGLAGKVREVIDS
jgi:two-component system cell cycle sensor histidine kinase/response regulator CckA